MQFAVRLPFVGICHVQGPSPPSCRTIYGQQERHECKGREAAWLVRHGMKSATKTSIALPLQALRKLYRKEKIQGESTGQYCQIIVWLLCLLFPPEEEQFLIAEANQFVARLVNQHVTVLAENSRDTAPENINEMGDATRVD